MDSSDILFGGLGHGEKLDPSVTFSFSGPCSPEFFLREKAMTSQPVKHGTLVSMCRTQRGRWETNVSALEFLIRSPVNSVMSP